MAIIFENIDTKETYAIDREREGKYYHAKLSALINSSNMSVNADRGQDFGVRLIPEQQALIEQWEEDPEVIERVSNWSKTMTEDLTHAEFLAYLLYQQELGTSPENKQNSDRRDSQREYELRVEALRVGKPKGMPAFEPKVARREETLESFMNGDFTGDASGDKATDEGQGVEPAKLGEAKTVVSPADAIAAKKAKAVAAKAADTTPKANEK
jgi:hypothetical protein